MNLRQFRFFAVWAILLLLGTLLLLWSLERVPIADIVQVLGSMHVWQLVVLALVNLGLIALFPWRWRLILDAQGYQISYLRLIAYRLVSFSASYFSPGQHFGGEPLQVLYLRNRHGLPGSTALAAVTLDRAIDVLVNFLVLALGCAALLANGTMGVLPLNETLLLVIVLLAIPVGYLVALFRRRLPVSFVLRRFSGRLVEGVRRAEKSLGELMQAQPQLLLQGILIAGVIWAGLAFEFWLALLFLGVRLGFWELTLVIVAGRIALFAPTPGAMGALEASQVLAMQALGFDPAYGLGLSLLIRARDVFFGLAGLALAGLLRKV